MILNILELYYDCYREVSIGFKKITRITLALYSVYTYVILNHKFNLTHPLYRQFNTLKLEKI